jgi:hypothetical protein
MSGPCSVFIHTHAVVTSVQALKHPIGQERVASESAEHGRSRVTTPDPLVSA